MEAAISVLVVEDNALNRKVAVSLLEKLGVRAETARTGEEAVAAVRAKNFELVLMDIELPGMGGLAATSEIRRWQAENAGQGIQRDPIMIVATTAHQGQDVRGQCLDAGMDEVVSKPLRVEDLENLIGRRQSGSRKSSLSAAGDAPAGSRAGADSPAGIERVGSDESSPRVTCGSENSAVSTGREVVMDLRQMVVFSLSKEKYAIDINYLKRIVWAGAITPVPGVPSDILGIVNLRGDIVAVVDLSQLLGLKTRASTTSKPSLLVTHNKGIDVAFLVDSVDNVIDLPSRSIDPPLITLEREYAGFLEGEAKVGEALIAILNYERIMASDKMRLK
jgi:chemotaxis signal transduction protein/DNA-binding NarL/FixJ family response regulator